MELGYCRAWAAAAAAWLWWRRPCRGCRPEQKKKVNDAKKG
jgi:hypothetical protein